MQKDRNWIVLFICGASGTGKSTLAYEIANHYKINVLEVDDIHLIMKDVTTNNSFPMIHYWDSGINWKDIGVKGNLDWLIGVSKEIFPSLKSLAERHVEDNVPLIIEGDFISCDLVASICTNQIKAIFVNENDKYQIISNYLKREGGESQEFRAEVSVAYNNYLNNICVKEGMHAFSARPWDTSLRRFLEIIT